MKVALFYIHNVLACHYALGGYKETLERMGHEVIDCPFPGNAVQNIDEVRKTLPTIEQLNTCDGILATYHEYAHPWLAAIYGFEAWSKLKPPVIARYDESMDRGDLQLPARMPELLRWAKYHFFPAQQDAVKFGGIWLPFGADTTIFHLLRRFQTEKGFRETVPNEKKYEIGFIGTLYQERMVYIQQLAPHIGPDVIFHCGNAFVQDLGGIRERESTELLAENYRQIKIFYCLPCKSKLIVEKIFEVMACGTFVMFPRLAGAAAENLSIFKDREHVVYYDHGYVAENAVQLKYFLKHDEERERIARAGGELVRSKYTLEAMLNAMLDKFNGG